jgi:hypothetical protein
MYTEDRAEVFDVLLESQSVLHQMIEAYMEEVELPRYTQLFEGNLKFTFQGTEIQQRPGEESRLRALYSYEGSQVIELKDSAYSDFEQHQVPLTQKATMYLPLKDWILRLRGREPDLPNEPDTLYLDYWNFLPMPSHKVKDYFYYKRVKVLGAYQEHENVVVNITQLSLVVQDDFCVLNRVPNTSKISKTGYVCSGEWQGSGGHRMFEYREKLKAARMSNALFNTPNRPESFIDEWDSECVNLSREYLCQEVPRGTFWKMIKT